MYSSVCASRCRQAVTKHGPGHMCLRGVSAVPCGEQRGWFLNVRGVRLWKGVSW